MSRAPARPETTFQRFGRRHRQFDAALEAIQRSAFAAPSGPAAHADTVAALIAARKEELAEHRKEGTGSDALNPR
jgi:hypothetical protein